MVVGINPSQITALLRDLAKAEPQKRRELAAELAEMARADSTGELFVKVTFLLEDSDAIVRRRIIQAIGKSQWPLALTMLSKCWEKDRDPTNLKALMTALSKHGDAEVAARIESYKAPDPVSQNVKDKALLLLKRRQSRPVAAVGKSGGGIGSIDAGREPYHWDTRLPEDVRIFMHCRLGVEGFLAASLKKQGFTPHTTPGLCHIAAPRSVREIFAQRFFTEFSIGVICPVASPELALQYASKHHGWTEALLRLTNGVIRYRLDISDGGSGKQNARRFAMIQQLSSLQPDWINDTHEAVWDFAVKSIPLDSGQPGYLFEATPKQWRDPRFTYRYSAVAGASHPTLAALLAAVSEVKKEDVVWDPFMGGAHELIEAAKLASGAQYFGTDIKSDAVTTAQENIKKAGMTKLIQCFQEDATKWQVPGNLTLMLTNPPMGRRVPVADLASLLKKVLQNSAQQLQKGGRIVFFSPLPKVSSDLLSLLGLRQSISQTVDLGGFHVELQRFDKV